MTPIKKTSAAALLLSFAALLAPARSFEFLGNGTPAAAHDADDQPDPEVMELVEMIQALELYSDPDGLVSSAVVERRLWGISFDFLPGIPDLRKFGSEVGHWVQGALEKIKDAIMFTFDQVKKIFNGAKQFLRDGLEVVKGAYEATKDFAGQLLGIFDVFKPIEKYFKKAGGMLLLMFNHKNLEVVGNVVMRLLECADEVFQIGSVVNIVSDFFEQIRDVFHQTLGKIVGGGRRLAEEGGYFSLLDGLDFSNLNRTFTHYAGLAGDVFQSLLDINATLRPLANAISGLLYHRRLSELDDPAPLLGWVVPDTPSRRLLGLHVPNVNPLSYNITLPDIPDVNFSEVKGDQGKYEDAVLGIVPAWSGLESLIMQVCGGVSTAIGAVDNLKCRVLGRGDDLSTDVQHAAEDCWDMCNQTSGFCSWCGKGGACCRQGEAEPEECSQVKHTSSGFHECVKPGSRVLNHRGEDCWDHCDEKSGKCAWCGEGNACCRGDESVFQKPGECHDVAHTKQNGHECVIPVDQVKVGFAAFSALPGLGYIQGLVQGCTEDVDNNTVEQDENGTYANCPAAMLSAYVRLSMEENAGVIGWVFAILELIISNGDVARLVFGFPFLLLGFCLCFYGYGFMGITYFITGFQYGLYIAAIVISILIAREGMCRGETFQPECTPEGLFGWVFLIALLNGLFLWKLRTAIEVIFGYNVGAAAASVFYIIKFNRELWDGLTKGGDEEDVEQLYWGLAGAAVAGGLVSAVLTYFLRKYVWIVGTSFIGSAIIIFACNMAGGTGIDDDDKVGWVVVTTLGMSCQYFLFIFHKDPNEKVMKHTCLGLRPATEEELAAEGLNAEGKPLLGNKEPVASENTAE